MAWIALFLTPVGIYWRLFTNRTPTPAWVHLAAFGVLAAFVGTAMRIESLRPIRTFLQTVLALGAGLLAVALIERTHAWTHWAARTSYPKVVFADSALEVIPCLFRSPQLRDGPQSTGRTPCRLRLRCVQCGPGGVPLPSRLPGHPSFPPSAHGRPFS